MKIVLVLFIVFPVLNFGQDNNYQEDNLVTGLIYSEESIFLVMENGFIELEQYDAYEEYYRRIYNDSTIVNPNLEIKGEYNLNYIPFLLLEVKQQSTVSLTEPVDIGLLITINKANNYVLTNYAQNIVDSLKEN